MKKSKYGLDLYADGTVCRMKNKRIIIQELKDGGYNFTLTRITDKPELSTAIVKVDRNKITTYFRLSAEAVAMIVSSIIHLQNQKLKNEARIKH